MPIDFKKKSLQTSYFLINDKNWFCIELKSLYSGKWRNKKGGNKRSPANHDQSLSDHEGYHPTAYWSI